MSVWRSGNAVHTADKYFISSAERDQNGRLSLTIASAGGYGKLSNTKQIKDLLKNNQIKLVVLSCNEDIAFDAEKMVRTQEERYVTDFDGRGVRSTMREIPVFVNPNTDQMSVEIDGKVLSVDRFFK
ncbi:MAG: photosystem P840 reaction center protein PscD [Chlorobiales bacterium]|jgi:photosystem P840 reaction center protein PscD|nr:photosystem P840 reaction center protein PscD [Chlorobiales bacterium]